mmetsp:Transcript_12693/g.30213  ORF Transcript_12693/g.30213 Transcript_12693/m.30213 type:complete len:208 (+) Transcript_12693:53-676(+)
MVSMPWAHHEPGKTSISKRCRICSSQISSGEARTLLSGVATPSDSMRLAPQSSICWISTHVVGLVRHVRTSREDVVVEDSFSLAAAVDQVVPRCLVDFRGSGRRDEGRDLRCSRWTTAFVKRFNGREPFSLCIRLGSYPQFVTFNFGFRTSSHGNLLRCQRPWNGPVADKPVRVVAGDGCYLNIFPRDSTIRTVTDVISSLLHRPNP